MNSYSGRLADVGESRCNCLPRVRVNASERLCLGHPFLKHHVVREIQRRRSSLVGKSAQTSAECINKSWLAVSPVMDILSIWFLDYHVDLISLN